MRQDDHNWFLIMNEMRARVLRGLPRNGEAPCPELVMRAKSENLRRLLSRDLAQGLMSKSGEYGEHEEPLYADERDFVRQVVSMLEAHRAAGDFAQLTVFAEPHTLGLLNQEMSPWLRQKVVLEIAKNLIGIAEPHLPKHVREEIAAH